VAKKSPHPGRTVLVFFLTLFIVFGLVALGGKWKPELGLDLQGGTRITLITKDNNVSPDSLKQAADIIDQRVNGSGVTEAEVTTQGNRFVVVEIPGANRPELVSVVEKQAQLRFRLVAQEGDGSAGSSALPTGQPGPTGVVPNSAPTSQPTAQPSAQSSKKPTKKASTGNNRPAPAGLLKETTAPTPTSTPTTTPSGTASPSATPSSTPATPSSKDFIQEQLAWQKSPDQASLAAYNAFSCPPNGEAVETADDPSKPLITCGEVNADGSRAKYLLSPAIIEGTQLKDSSYGIPDKEVKYAVNLDFNGDATKAFGTVTGAIAGTGQLFAIVLDGQVISAPRVINPILDGNAQITGDFTQEEARALSTSLKFGSLPIAFKDDPSVEAVGPSLAGDQLSAGITAGIIGLVVVMLYCLIYYRGLGVVVVASLLVAGASTYGLVLLLSKNAGFTLTLPGIAGLIVAVGITADSFIVFFERIRDEMRDGKSMRVAVETGWLRARNTCLAADTVSLLAAVVLYFFAAGVVKGFAFALGLSTLIDLAVFFWFTKPMVSWLATFSFFNQGHKLSGLDAEHIGVDSLPGLRVGGKA
jgi:preprotein translocase subunit SecD